MNRTDTIKYYATPILAFVLIFLIINSLNNNIKRKGTVKIKTVSESALTSKTPNKLSYQMIEEEGKKLKLKRDPFTSAIIISEEKSSSRLYLSGILWDDIWPAAIINGRILKIGDTIDKYNIVDITKESVILSDGDNYAGLKLGTIEQ